jgi:UDP-N-acetylglucosamine--N-acetylmuramyl-(pentapeptide) pyrophosphoryl-undecaprenol N-acetylglucosamine transferase
VKRHSVETLWVGGEGGMEEELVKRADVSYRSIPAAGVHGVGLRALPGNLAKLMRGVSASRQIVMDFHPDVLFFTGGYVAAPMAFAGREIPTLLYVPDIEPGLALKFLARFADRIALTTPDSQEYFPQQEKLVVTGYPLRADLKNWSRERANQHLGLSTDYPTLLIFGGSKGARSINMAVLKYIRPLLEMTQIVHITGSLDWSVVEAAFKGLPEALSKRYHIMPYLHEMGAALAAADLVISRAGASTLGEYPFFGLPAILVPYPHAWRYQKINADYLARRGAAVILQDELLEEKLLVITKTLLESPDQRTAMATAMQTLSHPGAADAIASQLLELAGVQPL